MAYTNSDLVKYKLISPNKYSGRKKIDRITPHCVVGQCSIESLANVFAPVSRQASSNYGIGYDGKIGLFVDESDTSWCSSSYDNDCRAITIECASDTYDPYAMYDVVYESLVELCADICKRNGKTKLLWFADKNKSLSYSPTKTEMVITVHRWFANKSCPGDWLYDRLGDLATRVTAALSGSGSTPAPAQTTNGTKCTDLAGLTNVQIIGKIGKLFTADQKKSGILASVSLAQFILESACGKSELAVSANNCFGMKQNLSGNTWSGSTWDGKSIYTKQTGEEYNGKRVTITANFRKYSCIEDSIADHSAYLLGSMNGNKKRYEGLKGCTDYKKAIKIIKDGGYATSSTYVENIINVINQYNLTTYDVASSGASVNETVTAAFDPYIVRVKIDDLNIRTGPGVGYTALDMQLDPGSYTIVEEQKGKLHDGTLTTWGRLKSGIGWICLDFAEKVRNA